MSSYPALSAAEQRTLMASVSKAVARFAVVFSSKLGRDYFSKEDIEDMVQDTLLKAWRSIDGYDPTKGKMSTWVSRIAINCVKDTIDYRVKRIAISDSFYNTPLDDYDGGNDEDESVLDSKGHPHISEDTADALVERHELEQRISREIGKLSDKNRRFASLMMDECAPRHMADIEGCTPNAAAKRVCDIRKALREALADVAEEFGFKAA